MSYQTLGLTTIYSVYIFFQISIYLAHFLQLQFSCQELILGGIFRILAQVGAGDISEAVFRSDFSYLSHRCSVYRVLQVFYGSIGPFMSHFIYIEYILIYMIGKLDRLHKEKASPEACLCSFPHVT